MGEYLINAFYGIGIADVLDILIVAFLIYKVLVFIRKAGVQQLLQGIILLVAAMVASDLLNLHTINWLLRSVVAIGAVALIIKENSKEESCIMASLMTSCIWHIFSHRRFVFSVLSSTRRYSVSIWSMIAILCGSLIS